MPSPVSDDELLRSYLLGTLPEEERSEIEARLLADDSLLEAAAALEGDLLADYAADELSAGEAQVIRRWLAASTDVRQRFELISALAKSAEQPSSEDRRQADALWERIAALTPEQRRRSLAVDRELWSWALCERVCAESFEAAADNVQRALALAELAVDVAERIPGEPAWRSRVAGYAWASVANARRVANDLPGADQAMALGRRLWAAGAAASAVSAASAASADVLAEWRLDAIEISLHRDQGRYALAVELADRALAIAPPEAQANILIRKAITLDDMGHSELAAALLEQAAPLASGADPRLRLSVDYNRAFNLWLQERAEEAAALLPGVRALAEALGNDLDLVRVGWLEGRVAAGLGRLDEAATLLEEARRAYALHEMPDNFTMTSLDLALVARERGRPKEIQRLAAEIVANFREWSPHRLEVLAAVMLFREAAEKDQVTTALVKGLQDFLVRAQSDPSLRFEP